MKKSSLVLFAVSVLSLSLWLARQRADVSDSLEGANEAMLRGKYADALRAYEKLAATPGPNSVAARRALLRCLLTTGQYEKVEDLTDTYLIEENIATRKTLSRKQRNPLQRFGTRHRFSSRCYSSSRGE
jgi:hypothetical protein